MSNFESLRKVVQGHIALNKCIKKEGFHLLPTPAIDYTPTFKDEHALLVSMNYPTGHKLSLVVIPTDTGITVTTVSKIYPATQDIPTTGKRDIRDDAYYD